MTPTLRPYQQQAISDLRMAYRNGSAAPLLVAPTGMGKTVVFAAITQAAAARGRQVLILVHRRELIHQASAKLAAIGVDHGVIAAGITPANASVQVASVQTLIRRLDCAAAPDLIIIDEAHHAVAGNTWGRIIDHWPNSLLLGVTATPVRQDGRGLGSMFDQLVLGPSTAELITTGYLTPARIYAPPPVADLTGIHRRAGDYAIDEAAERMDRPTVTGDAISHYQRIGAGQPAIAFCCNVKHAEHVCHAFKVAGIRAATLLGNTTDRDALVARFAAGFIDVLVTVDVVSEGFDCPGAAVAILLRPTQSEGLYLQQIGRVLRPAPGKQAAVVLDHVGNVHRHGFPDDHRNWTLADRERRAGSAGTPAPSVRTCPECFAAFKPAPVCPCCGHDCAPKIREIQQVDGELQEIFKDVHGQRLERGSRVRLAAYPGKYFFFGGPVIDYVGSDLVQVFKKSSMCHKQLNHLEITAMQKLHNDPLIVFNTFRGMVERSGGKLAGQGKARTLPELLAVAKERGYSPGWAKHVHNARQRS
jgi:DNA repair protein RadD